MRSRGSGAGDRADGGLGKGCCAYVRCVGDSGMYAHQRSTEGAMGKEEKLWRMSEPRWGSSIDQCGR